VVILHRVADPQIFILDGVVLAHQLKRRFVVEAPPLALHLQVRFGQQLRCLPSAVAALYPAGDPALAAP
jgi:hypothetical protein